MILEGEPNDAHYAVARLEKEYEVSVITQNGDDFHERAGSTKVIHLHGEALKNTSTKNPYIPFDIDPDNPDIKIGDKAPDGSQVRPYVIFFNENLDYYLCKAAITAIKEADIMVVIGCSLKVFPAAGMIRQLRKDASLIVIDPGEDSLEINRQYKHLKLPATKGMQILEDMLKEL